MTSSNSDLSDKTNNSETSNDNSDVSEQRSPNTTATTQDDPAFGWSNYAERVNGRFAMVGLAAVLLIEAISGTTFLHWAGFF